MEPEPTEPTEPTPEPTEPTPEPTEPTPEPTPEPEPEPTPEPTPEPLAVEPVEYEPGYLVEWITKFVGDAPFGLEWLPYVTGTLVLLYLLEFVFDMFRDFAKMFTGR